MNRLFFAVALTFTSFVANAHAQSLRMPKMLFIAASATDATTMVVGIGRGKGAREDDPLIAWADSRTGIIAAGTGIETLGALSWMKATKNHPKLQAAGFLIGAGLHGFFAARNIARMNQRPLAFQRTSP